ncbi:MAG: AAA family ATPase [Solirubrobacterales bacterium]
MIREVFIGSGIGIVIFLAILGFDVFPIVFVGIVAAMLYSVVQTQMKGNFAGLRSSGSTDPGIVFDDIGGQDIAIKELKEALEFLLKPAAILEMGIRPLRGILLVGPPGTGKTLLAKAAANFTASSFVATSGSEFIEMYAGVGARRVRQLFQDARKKAKSEGKNSAIVFIDELEILGGRRGSNQSHMEYDQTLNQLLVEMDGISGEHATRVLVVGATNRADMLDPALTRPGRFDRQVQVSLPDKHGRAKILEIHTKNKPVSSEVSIDELSKATFGFSGAQLESLTNEAAIMALRENVKEIKPHHFYEAVDKVILGEKLDRRPSPSEIERVGIHETGHAVISEIVKPGSVSSLTIVPRGQALGFMRKASPENDQYLYTLDDLKGQGMVALAGAIAEELHFGQRSTGARNDFEQAWNVVREIIKSGLSAVGVVDVNEMPKEMAFQECSRLMQDIERETRDLLQRHLTTFERVARRLMEEETLNRERFIEVFELQAS